MKSKSRLEGLAASIDSILFCSTLSPSLRCLEIWGTKLAGVEINEGLR